VYPGMDKAQSFRWMTSGQFELIKFRRNFGVLIVAVMA
jgi:hypothetical protein